MRKKVNTTKIEVVSPNTGRIVLICVANPDERLSIIFGDNPTGLQPRHRIMSRFGKLIGIHKNTTFRKDKELYVSVTL